MNGAPNWRTEAARAGIDPWPYCRRTMGAIPSEGVESRGVAVSAHLRAVEVPDLSDPDTLAVFDRRLALRLGAPGEAAAEGVIVYKIAGGLRIIAGGDLEPWTMPVYVDAPDILLARVRAWASVKT